MATVSYQQLERMIRALTFDTRQSDLVCDPDVVAFAIDRAAANVFQRLNTPPALVASFLSLVAADYDYALSATYADAEQLSGFRLLSTGAPVVKLDLPVWQWFRTGNPVETGPPKIIAFSEAATGVVTAYVWPVPSESDTMEATFSAAAGITDPQFRDTGAEVYDSAITALDLPGQSARAVVYLAAAEMIAAMGDEKIAKLGLNPTVAKLYMSQYENVMEAELDRNARLRRSGVVVQRNAF